MENASKALIFAGAILLAILLIGLGVFIYTQASNSIGEVGLTQLQIQRFNAQFEPYFRNNVLGTTAMALWDTVNANNAVASSDQQVQLILFEGLSERKITSDKTAISQYQRYNIECNEITKAENGGLINRINIIAKERK